MNKPITVAGSGVEFPAMSGPRMLMEGGYALVVVPFTMGKGTFLLGVIPGVGLTTLLDTATNEVHLVAKE